MKVANCDHTQADYVAWYKYKTSYEEKMVLLPTLTLIASTVVFVLGQLSGNIMIAIIPLIVVATVMGLWCLYTLNRLKKELPLFLEHTAGKTTFIRFVKSGIEMESEGERSYCPFEDIPKAREVPWYLFLFLKGEEYPLIIDKEKIETASDRLEPYYIAKMLREKSPNYKYVRNEDLTYTGKYRKLLKH